MACCLLCGSWPMNRSNVIVVDIIVEVMICSHPILINNYLVIPTPCVNIRTIWPQGYGIAASVRFYGTIIEGRVNEINPWMHILRNHICKHGTVRNSQWGLLWLNLLGHIIAASKNHLPFLWCQQGLFTTITETVSCHDAKFVVTGGIGSCSYDNLRCHQ